MHRSGRPEEEVKIAVLDTGLDIGHLLLRTYQDKGQIDVENYIDFTDPNNKKPTDDVGHGTCCTHLILKTCHAAKIYVAKVFRKATPDNDTADCIAKAIEHAVEEWKVDIVSMSFSFNEEQPQIKIAIENALKGQHRVLFLAAASNFSYSGQFPIGYPARYKQVLCVNSATPQGEKSKFSPAPRDRECDYSVLGEHLTTAFPTKRNKGNHEKRQSGTSMATAIMAGVAGLVVEYSRSKALETPIRHRDRLLSADGMRSNAHLCVQPWLLFREANENISWQTTYEINKALESNYSIG
ncbi:subtilisin-like protein [Trichoderma sp. SZMC 28014]